MRPGLKPPCHTVVEEPYREFTAGSDTNGYVFDSWTGCDTVNGRVCGLTVSQDTSLTARFRDAQAPSVSLTSPSSGVQRGTGTVSASASDNSGTVSRVDFLVGGATIATDTTTPYSVSFDTTSKADGSYSFEARAYDGSGNLGTTTRTLTIDNTAPSLSVTDGPEGQTFGPGSTQTWNFSASDATSGLQSVQCSVVPAGSAPDFGDCSGGNSSHSVSNLAEGNYSFAVRARDNGGLETTQTRVLHRHDRASRARHHEPCQQYPRQRRLVYPFRHSGAEQHREYLRRNGPQGNDHHRNRRSLDQGVLRRRRRLSYLHGKGDG